MPVKDKRGQAFNTKIEFVMLFKTEVLKHLKASYFVTILKYVNQIIIEIILSIVGNESVMI